ncbi:MAG: hypothetical protein C4293_18825 [Nitrospiraceae bacterium]
MLAFGMVAAVPGIRSFWLGGQDPSSLSINNAVFIPKKTMIGNSALNHGGPSLTCVTVGKEGFAPRFAGGQSVMVGAPIRLANGLTG